MYIPVNLYHFFWVAFSYELVFAKGFVLLPVVFEPTDGPSREEDNLLHMALRIHGLPLDSRPV